MKKSVLTAILIPFFFASCSTAVPGIGVPDTSDINPRGMDENRKAAMVYKSTGKVIARTGQYADVCWAFRDGLCLVISKEGMYGYLDSKGELAIPFKFDYAEEFSEGLAYAFINSKTKAGKYDEYYIDTDGDIVIELSKLGYTPAGRKSFSGGLLGVRTEYKGYDDQALFGAIDRKGKVVIPVVHGVTIKSDFRKFEDKGEIDVFSGALRGSLKRDGNIKWYDKK